MSNRNYNPKIQRDANQEQKEFKPRTRGVAN